MTTPTADSPGRRPRRRVWSVVVSGLAGVVAMILALVLIVVIRPLGWRFLAAALLWIPGVTALMLFADGLDQLLPSRKGRWAGEALHWLSASFVALALVVVIGAFVPSLLGVSTSPSLLAAIGCDVLIAILAGVLTFGLIAFSGWAGGAISDLVRGMRWARDDEPRRFRVSRKDGSWRDAIRIAVLPVAGVLLSAAFTQLFADVPSKMVARAADTTPKLPSAWTIVLPLAVWFLATAAVWFAFDWIASRNERTQPTAEPDQPPTGPDHAAAVPDRPPTGLDQPRLSHLRRRRATHASALAVGVAIVIGWASALVLNNVIQGSLTAHGTVTGVSIQTVPPAQQTGYLAQAFVPQFELAPGERWQPTTVDWYVAHSQLTKASAFCAPASGTEQGGCRDLCDIKSGAKCSPLCDDSDPDACAPVGGNPHAVYYIYRDATNTPNDHPAGAGHDWAVIEYWVFYNFDSLEAGLITQWHQSDWEQVSVLLDRRGSTVYPVEVAFSEHCYGAAVPATEVSWNGSHPVSFVGFGSHGNYPTANDLPIRQLQCLTRQTPRYLGAAGLFFNPRVAGWSLELPIAYLIGLRDQTGRAVTVADEQAISQQATPNIWSFHGYWGVDNNLKVVIGGVPTGAGPESPQDQNPSKKPFQNMFCSSSWLRVSPTPATSWVCPS